ncbi:MAG: PadR family transcriptional regulator [Ruminococcaceae bacterium]|nr:PadR family transcriptional regulator [Oscillospiraceae bacterium]
MPENDNPLGGMLMELRRGTAVLCALCRLKEPMYGYNLVSELAAAGIQAEANTLYPLLRRLESQGLLESHWDTTEAKPRKYYVTTEEGRKLYAELEKGWHELVESVDKIISNNQ